jgi:ABC-type multidrug transport system fused ATPase/permease subunit
MWGFIILSIVLALGVARIITGFEAQSVMSQWAKYRCMPNIMAFASMFKPGDDPRSDTQFTSDNFNFCTAEIAKSVLEIALKPVLDVVLKMIESAISSIGYVMNLRSLSSNLFHGLERMFDVFGRRFNMTIHEFHKTFLKQISAMQKANAIATASVFAGLSMIKAIMNAFELMIIVCLVILVILVVLVIFLFFLLAPTIPLIIIVLAIIGATAYAGSTGGMGEAFCFHPSTRVKLEDGTTKQISEITLNDKLADGSTVFSTMKFKTHATTELYEIDGVVVSGSHIIYERGEAKLVKDVRNTKQYVDKIPDVIYCLNTSSHRIPVVGATKSHEFADWEELDGDAMDDWSEFVYYVLNNESKRSDKVNDSIIKSETGFSAIQKVKVISENNIIIEKPMGELEIGDRILDLVGFTEIVGLVNINSSEFHSYGYLNYTFMSGATWLLDTDGIWKHAAESIRWRKAHPVSDILSIFTKSGTFKIGDTIYRDFSDIGLDNIEKSYNFTLSRLNSADA